MRRRAQMYLLCCLVLLSTLTSVATGAPRSSDLRIYFEKVRALYPEAEITGEFYDWRSTSRYRAHAGLHLGYDIALNAGRGVPAGWSGVVVDIVPWTDNECGVCVECPNGYRVTYGHLAPVARIGQVVLPGQIVGTIVRDHVDIKVRDRQGGYFDFGQSFGILDGSSPWANTSGGLLPPPPEEGDGTTAAPGADLEALYTRFREAEARHQARRGEVTQTQHLIATLSGFIDSESQGLPQAEAQLLAWHRAADSGAVTAAQVEALELQVDARRTRVNRLIYVLEQRHVLLRERLQSLAQAERAAAEARTQVCDAKGDSSRLARIEADVKAKAARGAQADPNDELARRAQQARERLRDLRARYQIGAAARTSLEEAEREVNRLQVAEVLWQQGDKDAARGLIY